MVVSSASRGGGRSLSFKSASLGMNWVWLRILSFSARVSREKITMEGSCLGGKKLRELTLMAEEIQFANMLHLSKTFPKVLLGSSFCNLNCRRKVARRAILC